MPGVKKACHHAEPPEVRVQHNTRALSSMQLFQILLLMPRKDSTSDSYAYASVHLFGMKKIYS